MHMQWKHTFVMTENGEDDGLREWEGAEEQSSEVRICKREIVEKKIKNIKDGFENWDENHRARKGSLGRVKTD